ncbi:hypothetical protein B296_00006128 [Ensete ventricosum]|uniref:Uncharacterized protein n=1 Tax=Ensete ventricosum TaxID=4639 RepID=A0A427ABV5_ENSVE|nr:hypothetical protein B296_00006128 [Ensete ventricosum]
MLFSSSHRWPDAIAPVFSSMASFALLALPTSKLSSPPKPIGACCPAVVGEGEVLASPHIRLCGPPSPHQRGVLHEAVFLVLHRWRISLNEQ